MSFLSLARYGDIWGAVLTVICFLCFFVNHGETRSQRQVHRWFRILLFLSCNNFTLACTSGPDRVIQRALPLVNNLMVRWLIASIFFMPAVALGEIIWMRHTRSKEKKRALITDIALALVYCITVAGTLAVTIAAQG